MDRLVDVRGVGYPLFKDFKKLTTTKLLHSVKKNHHPPHHTIFDLSEDLYEKGKSLEEEFEKAILIHKIQVFDFAKKVLTERKKENNVHFLKFNSFT